MLTLKINPRDWCYFSKSLLYIHVLIQHSTLKHLCFTCWLIRNHCFTIVSRSSLFITLKYVVLFLFCKLWWYTSNPLLFLTTASLTSEWAKCNASAVKATRRPSSQQDHSRSSLYNSPQPSDVVTFSSRTPLSPANEVVSVIAYWKGTAVWIPLWGVFG